MKPLKVLGVFLCWLVAGACAPGAGGAVGEEAAPGEVPGCAAGVRDCYCPDGTLSGTQSCDAGGALSSCSCPLKLAPPPGGVTGDPTRVCSELQGVQSCSATSYVSEQVPSSVLFVVDRSGSMACNAPPVQTVEACNSDPTRADPNQPSRWEITVAALKDAFAGLSGGQTAVGLALFSTDGYCGVDSAPEVDLAAPSAVHLAALSEAMAGADPAGGTPIVGGVVLAYRHLHQELHAAGNRYVVLITDGEESCGTQGDETNDADLETARNLLLKVEVQKARDANIKTFVIGAPGSEGARGFLSELAFRGGTARDPSCTHGDPTTGNCHFDLTAEADFGAVLRATIGQIGGRALGCEFRTPPGAVRSLNVQYSQGGGAPVCFAQDDAPCAAGANGWQFGKDAAGNEDTSRVVLCGGACDTVKADPTTVVDVILGCESIIR